jgi:hypothetical protein
MGGLARMREQETSCQRFDNAPGSQKHRATELFNESHGLSALCCHDFLRDADLSFLIRVKLYLVFWNLAKSRIHSENTTGVRQLVGVKMLRLAIPFLKGVAIPIEAAAIRPEVAAIFLKPKQACLFRPGHSRQVGGDFTSSLHIA